MGVLPGCSIGEGGPDACEEREKGDGRRSRGGAGRRWAGSGQAADGNVKLEVEESTSGEMSLQECSYSGRDPAACLHPNKPEAGKRTMLHWCVHAIWQINDAIDPPSN